MPWRILKFSHEKKGEALAFIIVFKDTYIKKEKENRHFKAGLQKQRYILMFTLNAFCIENAMQ